MVVARGVRFALPSLPRGQLGAQGRRVGAGLEGQVGRVGAALEARCRRASAPGREARPPDPQRSPESDRAGVGQVGGGRAQPSASPAPA